MRAEPGLSLRRKIILTLSGVLLSLVISEIGLRLFGFAFLSLQEYRNRAAVYKKGGYRIMCLGESTTAIGGRDSYPSQLEEILNRSGLGISFSVINKGVIGNNSSYILAHLEENLDKFRPDLVTAMMGVNDKLIKYYEDIPEANTWLFSNLKSYKLARILWMHIADKIRKKGISGLGAAGSGSGPGPVDSSAGLKKCCAKEPCVCQDQCPINTTQASPEEDKACLELGRSFRDNGDYARALQLFKKALALNPQNDMAYFELGACYINMSQDILALEMLRKAAELNPQNDKVYVELGRYYRDQGMHVESQEALKKAVAINPQGDWAYVLLGLCCMYQGKHAEAEAAFKKAIELNPAEDRAYGGIAALYEEMGKSSLAQEYYQLANNARLKYCDPRTAHNYQKLREILDKRGIKLVCIQYPARSIEPLKRMFQGSEGVIFVDNEKIFKDALKQASYRKYFADMFEGDFGHCTCDGNRVLAENIANVILKECFNRRK